MVLPLVSPAHPGTPKEVAVPRSETDSRILDLKIQVFGLLRRLEEGLAAATDARRATMEALDEGALRAYLAVETAPDDEAYIAFAESLRDLLATGLDGMTPRRVRAARGLEVDAGRPRFPDDLDVAGSVPGRESAPKSAAEAVADPGPDAPGRL